MSGNGSDPKSSWRRRLLAEQRWLPFVLPFAVFLLTGWLFADRPQTLPTADGAAAVSTSSDAPPAPVPSADDPATRPRGNAGGYAVQTVATCLAILFVMPVYRTVPWRVTGWAVLVGVVGAVLWILICRAQWEAALLTALGRTQWLEYVARPAYDPFAALGDRPWVLAAFLTLRMASLALLVPVAEEFFLRGFLMRLIARADWWEIPLGHLTWPMTAVGTLYGVLAHPAEWIAAAVWFSLITLLYWRTRSLWDCVIAHATTNGLLGIYIVLWRDWSLW